MSSRLRRTGLSALLSALSAVAMAQEPRWYEVEIIIFAHPETPHQEVWRENLELAYPPNWVQLQDPVEVEKAMQEAADKLAQELAEAEKAAEEQARLEAEQLQAHILEPQRYRDGTVSPETFPDHSKASQPEMSANAETDPTASAPLEAQENSAVTEPMQVEPEESEPILPPQLPLTVDLEREPYFWLPRASRQLNRQASAIRRSRDYRLLFHQAWRQPVVEQSLAPEILIAAGNPFGRHREVEGTVSLSVSRYLHLKTNLWFTRFNHNFGQEQGDWPELPVAPNLLPDPADEDLLGEFTDSLHWSENGTKPPHSPWDNTPAISDEYDQILTRPFVPGEISIMKQKRRMRSTEMHYLDHPKFGILVLTTPYELPPPEAPEEQTDESNEREAL
ncbi:hypothetical protein HBA55_16875 [Pseudomaricurvus alkylphenolicus]|uniref:CsiV family protein n=1 Tax=Pseudomaricurvus alkylphenolicus TaxID=1306991 RepID=UPI001423B36C|nr:CsiV family protein [Pseudomaricurvus alkylphenolicus]NIB41278.1 hypothetical protein [Pseudomaricurvus alkylphenolicus]